MDKENGGEGHGAGEVGVVVKEVIFPEPRGGHPRSSQGTRVILSDGTYLVGITRVEVIAEKDTTMKFKIEGYMHG